MRRSTIAVHATHKRYTVYSSSMQCALCIGNITVICIVVLVVHETIVRIRWTVDCRYIPYSLHWSSCTEYCSTTVVVTTV